MCVWQAGDKELLDCVIGKQKGHNGSSRNIQIQKGFYKTPPSDMFTPHTGQLRRHSEKKFKKQCCLDIRKNFFTQRVVKPLNKLTEDAVSQTKVDVFKKILRVAAVLAGLYKIRPGDPPGE